MEQQNLSTLNNITFNFERQKILGNLPQTDKSSNQLSSKQSIFNPNKIQPVIILTNSMQPTNQSIKSITQTQGNQPIQNPQKVKTASLSDTKIKHSNNKMEYLAFVKNQYKKEDKQIKAQQIKQKIKFANIAQNKYIKDELISLKNKMQKYLLQLQKRDQYIIQKQKQLFQKNKQFQNSKETIRHLEEKCIKYQNDYQFLNQKFQLMQAKSQQNAELKEIHQKTIQQCFQLQCILQQKNNQMKDMMISKDREYDALAAIKNEQIKMLSERLKIIQAQNSRIIVDFNKEIKYLRPQDGYKQKKTNPHQIDTIVKQLEQKVSLYIEQITRLKRLNNQYESQIEKLQHQKQSLQNSLCAYEDRDQIKSSTQQQQIQFLRLALDRQKEKSDHLTSHQQLQILKLQNQLSQKVLQTRGSLIDLFDEERLHQNLYLALEEVENLRKKLRDVSTFKK